MTVVSDEDGKQVYETRLNIWGVQQTAPSGDGGGGAGARGMPYTTLVVQGVYHTTRCEGGTLTTVESIKHATHKIHQLPNGITQ